MKLIQKNIECSTIRKKVNNTWSIKKKERKYGSQKKPKKKKYITSERKEKESSVH